MKTTHVRIEPTIVILDRWSHIPCADCFTSLQTENVDHHGVFIECLGLDDVSDKHIIDDTQFVGCGAADAFDEPSWERGWRLILAHEMHQLGRKTGQEVVEKRIELLGGLRKRSKTHLLQVGFAHCLMCGLDLFVETFHKGITNFPLGLTLQHVAQQSRTRIHTCISGDESTIQ
jgi:hypothetical protein